jgi:hypothetical protein
MTSCLRGRFLAPLTGALYSQYVSPRQRSWRCWRSRRCRRAWSGRYQGDCTLWLLETSRFVRIFRLDSRPYRKQRSRRSSLVAKTIQAGRKNKAECFFLSKFSSMISVAQRNRQVRSTWHSTCFTMERLHSGGGPNVNSRIRVNDQC